MKRRIAVFCGASVPRDVKIADAARALGRGIAAAGDTLVYGGSNLGLMGEVSGAALEERGTVVGVIPTLFSEEIINSQPVSELVRVASMAERKEYIICTCDAFVALPGGIGTLDEVLEVMVANQLHQIDKPMVLLNLDGYYDPFLSLLQQMRSEGLLRSDAGLISVDSVEDTMRALAADAAEIS